MVARMSSGARIRASVVGSAQWRRRRKERSPPHGRVRVAETATVTASGGAGGGAINIGPTLGRRPLHLPAQPQPASSSRPMQRRLGMAARSCFRPSKQRSQTATSRLGEDEMASSRSPAERQRLRARGSAWTSGGLPMTRSCDLPSRGNAWLRLPAPCRSGTALASRRSSTASTRQRRTLFRA